MTRVIDFDGENMFRVFENRQGVKVIAATQIGVNRFSILCVRLRHHVVADKVLPEFITWEYSARDSVAYWGGYYMQNADQTTEDVFKAAFDAHWAHVEKAKANLAFDAWHLALGYIEENTEDAEIVAASTLSLEGLVDAANEAKALDGDFVEYE